MSRLELVLGFSVFFFFSMFWLHAQAAAVSAMQMRREARGGRQEERSASSAVETGLG